MHGHRVVSGFFLFLLRYLPSHVDLSVDPTNLPIAALA